MANPTVFTPRQEKRGDKNIPSEKIQRLLAEVCNNFDNEDRASRERQIRTWRHLKLLWEGFTRTWYSEIAHDWRIWDEQAVADSNNDQAYYDKPVNVFRAYLESIIAALSVTVPPVTCYPDDADNPLDLLTAKAGDKIAELLYRHNDVPLLWLHALFIYCTEGAISCYTYPDYDEKYGTYEEDEYEDVNQTQKQFTCPTCGFVYQEDIVDQLTDAELDEFQPGDDDVTIQNLIQENGGVCPNCSAMVDPELKTSPLIVQRLVGKTKKPKGRICMEAYGGLFVKTPNYAMCQEDMPYLRLAYETHYSNCIEEYPDLYDKLRNNQGVSAGVYDQYERWGRLPIQYHGEYPRDTITVRKFWLRPSAFNILKEEESKELKKLYPNGAKVVLINDCFACACNESLDDCWTISRNPLADYSNHDPLGLLLVSIQDITNELISLILQTIEHGIPQTFADPTVLDFDKYRQMETIPGAIYPTKMMLSGQNIKDKFYEVRTATLSQEVLPFSTQIQTLGQMVVGAQPSIFGGQLEGSKTASEYSMSRAQALQRLQTTWKMLTFWWKSIFGKAIPMFIKEMKDDEREVTRDEQGNFLNVFIRKSETEGKIGKVELEANENLPMTWNQRKDIVMQLLQASNPEILATMGEPENLPIIREAIGLTDFIVPGEADRNKQYEEIKQLVNSMPMPQPDQMTGQLTEVPSVPVEQEVDNHQIQFEVCRVWLISEAGLLAKTENQEGYKNVLLHAMQHKQALMMQQMQQAQAQAGATSTEKPNELDREAPIQGEENVGTTH